MDDIDLFISMMLMGNSRIPYKELANTFGMSVNSIHKRVKSMVDLGIIKNFNTKISLSYFPNTSNVILFGVSRAKNAELLIDKLGENEFIYNATKGSSNYIYAHANIKNLNQLDSVVSFMKTVGEMDELTVGLESETGRFGYPETKIRDLSNLDFLIINSLKDNSRKNISDIAVEVGANTKTVKRRLDRMIENNLINFSIDWYPDKTPMNLSMVKIKLKSKISIDKSALIGKIREICGSSAILIWKFSNLPDTLLLCLWTRTTRELQKFENDLNLDEFDSIKVNVLVKGKNFPNWRTTFLEDKIKEIKAIKD
ncbi:MAG: winged helix-turn-helix transcriptional regulator [Candidatus Thorarchaeota archaeon]